MALRPDKQVVLTHPGYFMFNTAEKGGVVCAVSSTSGVSGTALDATLRRVEYTNNPSGRTPVGLLMSDVVNIDFSRSTLNPYKPDEVQVGNKVNVLLEGIVVTDRIATGQATGIQVPAPAYLGHSGLLFSNAGSVGSGWPQVGRFLSTRDSAGFAEVHIQL